MTQDMKWTPGPWKADGYYVYANDQNAKHGLKELANVEGELCTTDEDEANRHLMAAAPELYGALSAIKWKSIDKDNMEFSAITTYCVMDIIQAALAKARGESDG